MARYCHLSLLMMIIHVSVDVTQSACSTACISCTYDTCASCDVGSYLESGSCHTCPKQCTSCSNSDLCNNCEAGYFGSGCERTCYIQGCVNITCDKDSGRCTYGCIDGYFLSGTMCYPCAVNCKKCVQYYNKCTECKEGFYGPSCQYPCSHCKDGICSRKNCTYGCSHGFFLGDGHCTKCPHLCTTCDALDNCHSCVDGYSGPSCQSKCSVCSPISRVCGQEDSTELRLYLAIAGWSVAAILAAIVMTGLIMYRRKINESKTTETLHIRSTEEHAVSQDYTTLAMETRGDGDLYSSLDNTDNIAIRE